MLRLLSVGQRQRDAKTISIALVLQDQRSVRFSAASWTIESPAAAVRTFVTAAKKPRCHKPQFGVRNTGPVVIDNNCDASFAARNTPVYAAVVIDMLNCIFMKISQCQRQKIAICRDTKLAKCGDPKRPWLRLARGSVDMISSRIWPRLTSSVRWTSSCASIRATASN